MQSSTIIVLACLVAAVTARAYPEVPEVEAVHIPEDAYELDTPTHESSVRNKRGLLLLKKKLLLGALGLKAAKVGAVGAAGVAGALALKKKAAHTHHHAAPAVHHTSSHYGYSR
ncbi:hypothetical protein O0L34_g9975 [Tuta absoluta]|nr:hypothetical protein O0L34_g9975 [Tuta absoluta]